MASTKIAFLTGMLLATTYSFLINSQYKGVLLKFMLLATGYATANTYGFLINSHYKGVLLTGMLLTTGFSTATTYDFLSNSHYKIVSLTGMLLTTGYVTATAYGFLSNSHYKILRYLRFPTIFLLLATIYFVMGFSNGEKLEFVKIIVTCFQSFDAQKVVEFITQIPLSMWLFASFTLWLVIWSYSIHGIATSLFKEYFQQNEHATQSTSAILHSLSAVNIFPSLPTVNIFPSLSTVNIFPSPSTYNILASLSRVFTGITLHSPTTYVFVLFSVGIVLLIPSILFFEGKKQLALAFIAITLAAPGYICLVRWTIKFCKT